MKTIPLFKVYINKDVDGPLLETLHSGYIGQGPKVEEFENLLSEKLNSPNVLTLSSGTHGLHLALRDIGITEGDEVITTPLTCLHYNTRIKLSDGRIERIGVIVNKKIKGKILSFNTKTNMFEEKEIINWVKNTMNSHWYYITHEFAPYTNQRKQLGVRVTEDHKVLTKRGEIRADSLTELDEVLLHHGGLNTTQMEFIYGTLLGDASIEDCGNKSCRLEVYHSDKQLEWLLLKQKQLNEFCTNTYKKVQLKNNSQNKGMCLKTANGTQWSILHNKWYKNNVKILPNDLSLYFTPLLLATWYMDDGSYNKNNGECVELATNGFNTYEIDILINLFNTKFNLKCIKKEVKNNQFIIYIGNGNNKHNSCKKFLKLVAPYILKDLQYKLPTSLHNNINDNIWKLGSCVPLYSKVKVYKENSSNNDVYSKYSYCIEVLDNHNFVCQNMVFKNCTATNWPILMEQGKIVWADIDETTLNISPRSIQNKITDKTKAIMVMHWSGIPCDMEKIHNISNEYNIPIIEDAAHAFGATYKNTKIGDCTYSDYTMFSFQAIKLLTSIDGGILCIKNDTSYKRLKLLRWYGIDREGLRRDLRCEAPIIEYGYKYHMNDICATIGIENLKHTDKLLKVVRDNAQYYTKMLNGISGIKLLTPSYECNPSYWMYSILVDDIVGFARLMGEKGIHVSKVHERNDIHPCTMKFQSILPILDKVMPRLICIPCGWWVTKEDREYIVNTIKEGW